MALKKLSGDTSERWMPMNGFTKTTALIRKGKDGEDVERVEDHWLWFTP